MYSIVIYKQRVNQWETCPHYIRNYPTNQIASLQIDLEKNNMEFVCSEPVNRLYSREELISMLWKFMPSMAKTITREIIEGKKQLPKLEELPQTSRNICTVVTSMGDNLYVSLPIHFYHAWRSLEDNDKDNNVKRIITAMKPGSLFIRLPTLEELDEQTFIHHESLKSFPLQIEYISKLRDLLRNSSYAEALADVKL